MKTRIVQNPERDAPLSGFYRSEQNCVNEVLSVVLLKIKVFWDRWLKPDPVCMNSCIHDPLFCFLHSTVGVFYVSATDCMQWVAVD
jgi:hypothetical protein